MLPSYINMENPLQTFIVAILMSCPHGKMTDTYYQFYRAKRYYPF